MLLTFNLRYVPIGILSRASEILDAVFQFSTDAFSQRERITAWRELVGRSIVNVDIEPLDAAGFVPRRPLACCPALD